MTGFTRLRPAARIYVVTVVCAGTAAVAEAGFRLYLSPLDLQWLILAGLTLLTGFFTVKVPAINARISVSETFVFASVLLFGPPAGTITVLLESLIILFWMPPSGRQPHRLAFNMAAPTIAIWVSGNVFFLTSGIQPYSTHATPLPVLFLPLAAFTVLYFLLNSWLVALAVGLENKTSAYEVWSKNFIWLSVNYFSGASVAALIVTYTRQLDISTLAIIVPLLVVSYLTFKTAMARVEDSNQHLSELNRLHLSTIETLAMAIDAKDQITHGHIRRVQTYAVGLAHRLGVVDDKLIKAIEAAALLHDMGKLAVPEYILNKPGKLTSAEFDKMKLHASVGADILSAIAFPYPVVPIVRHHHENWDGTGYPDALKGTDIPIGARILSVVDCFDALTSDRPYRPRLTDEDAIAILIQRRGSMYDPLIVDTFIRVHRDIGPEPDAIGSSDRAIDEISGSAQTTDSAPRQISRLDDISASADETLTVYELARGLAAQSYLPDAADLISQQIRRLIPTALVVVYVYNVELDELEARYVIGDCAAVVSGLRIRVGQRLSGWVAANRQTIVNSDPALDFGDVARTVTPRLRSCLSAPLENEGDLIGVVSLYSTSVDAFSDNHRRVLEMIAREAGKTLARLANLDESETRDEVTGLGNGNHLKRLIDSRRDGVFSLLRIECQDMKRLSSTHGRQTVDDGWRHIVSRSRTVLRLADALFRISNDELVAFVDDSDPEIAKQIASRIEQAVCLAPLVLKNGGAVAVNVRVELLSTSDRKRVITESSANIRGRKSTSSNSSSTVH